MFHKSKNCFSSSYYDTMEEIPTDITVFYPKEERRDAVTIPVMELSSLCGDDYRCVMHSVNYGCCDHWDAVTADRWISECWSRVIRYTDKDGRTVGYNRPNKSVCLTRDKNYRVSEVWNS